MLVAREDIELGQRVSAADFGIARVAADGAQTITAEAAANFEGTSASTRIPAGTLLNRSMFLASSIVPDGAVVVGVVLSPAQRPAEDLRSGDVVRVFAVPRDAGGSSVGSVLEPAVRVAERGPTAGGDVLRLSLLVPEDSAAAIVAAAATNSIAVTRLAADTRPAVDFRRDG